MDKDAQIERLTERCDGYKGQVEAGAAVIERLRAALAPFAAFAEAHYNPEIGVKDNVGLDRVWLCPSPGYPKITTQCFVAAHTALGSDLAPKGNHPEPQAGGGAEVETGAGGNRCPTCDSTAPHLHPAVQQGGEVEICKDAWHGAKASVNEQLPEAES